MENIKNCNNYKTLGTYNIGLKAVDAMVPIGRGQKELIIGDRQKELIIGGIQTDSTENFGKYGTVRIHPDVELEFYSDVEILTKDLLNILSEIDLEKRLRLYRNFIGVRGATVLVEARKSNEGLP